MPGPRIDIDEVLSQIKIAVLSYKMRNMANAIGKQYQTLSNELDHRENFKLGAITLFQILEITQEMDAPVQSREAGIKVLDMIEDSLGRVAFQIPIPVKGDMLPVMAMVGAMSKEFGESIQDMAAALADGHITRKEAQKCMKEIWDVVKECVKLWAYLRDYTGETGHE